MLPSKWPVCCRTASEYAYLSFAYFPCAHVSNLPACSRLLLGRSGTKGECSSYTTLYTSLATHVFKYIHFRQPFHAIWFTAVATMSAVVAHLTKAETVQQPGPGFQCTTNRVKSTEYAWPGGQSTTAPAGDIQPPPSDAKVPCLVAPCCSQPATA